MSSMNCMDADMVTCSVVCVLVIPLLRGGLGFGRCLVISLAAAVVTTYVELYTKGGYDTITCPTAAMVVILPLIKILRS